MKIVSQCREQARQVYYGAVLKAKKEIHGKILSRSAESRRAR
jgi:hypothetical protein